MRVFILFAKNRGNNSRVLMATDDAFRPLSDDLLVARIVAANIGWPRKGAKSIEALIALLDLEGVTIKEEIPCADFDAVINTLVKRSLSKSDNTAAMTS